MDINWWDAIPGVNGVDLGYQALKGAANYDPGLPGQYQDRQAILNGINGGMNRQAPIANQAQSDQWRQMQMTNANNLMGIASGQRQGAGELAAQRQVANAVANQQGMANMARGGANAGMAMRQAARNQAGIGLAGAGQAQQAALGDQQMAYGQLGGLMQGARGQDQANAFANQQANLGQQQIGLGYFNNYGSMDANQLQAQQAAKAAQNQFYGGLIAQGGQMAGAMSDERVKTDIAPAGDEVDEMLRNLTPFRYTYKNQERHGQGSRVGIMAQDLRKSKAGTSVTRDTPDGIALDINAAVSAALAGSARLDERLRKVEGKK